MATVSARTRRFALVVATIVLVSGLAVTASATTPASEPLNSTEANTTPSHQNPTEVSESGDSQEVGSYLARQLGSRLNASAIATSDEEYETGLALIGNEYDVLLEKYATVSADTDLAETAAQFNLTREQQREIITSAQQLNQTAAAYQQAVENGNEEEARALARNIVQNASELNQSTTALNQRYGTLETETNLNFDAAQEALNVSQRRLTQAAGAVAAREFTETTLTIQPAQSNLSATEPTAVSGRLTAANGTAIANATIQIGIGEDTITARTRDNGTYTAMYQPLVVAPNASVLTATYTPAPAAPYLSSTASTNISVHGQPATSITVTNATTEAQFGDSVNVSGYTNITDRDAGSRVGLPVTLQVAGEELAQTETTANGSFRFQIRLPEQIPAGETTLRVVLATEDLILPPSNTTVPLTVASTPTVLTVEMADNEGTDQNVSIAGTLTTEEGEPLADRSLQLQLADTPIETVETDATGQYQTTIDRAEISEETQMLTVEFAPTGSNIEASTAEQTLPVSSTSPFRRPILVGGILTLLIAGGLLTWWRDTTVWRWLRNQVAGENTSTQSAVPSATDTRDESLPSSVASEAIDSSSDTLIERAQTALDAGDPDAAVQFAYAAFRTQMTPADGDLPETHWELYDRWQGIDHSDSSEIHQLTTAYEQATFAPESVSTETAQTVVGMLPSIVGALETHSA
ncbi:MULTISPECIES: hypothetical protein [unclassified Halorubrum]|uniref:hypothetical protein n=1 Tax=unclassified Halorubrum TaxID=2642239 RepID=UPI0011C454D0|nr:MULTISPECIES: hypothetical protein [unclassified Halorubrum]